MIDFDVEYYEYECGNACTPNGCCGHSTDIPVEIYIDGVRFSVDGYDAGDFPGGADKEEIDRVKKAVKNMERVLKQKNKPSSNVIINDSLKMDQQGRVVKSVYTLDRWEKKPEK